MSAYEVAIGKLVAGDDLARTEAVSLMAEIMEGSLEPTQVAAVLTALATKGEAADELAGFAAVMRRNALTISVGEPVLDTCGTGGSGLPTINTSTLAAFVVAAAGAKVAKHGNRASSGRCGSTDVLEHLGVHIELTPAQAEELLRHGPIVVMYARRHHPAVGRVTPVRRALGFRTVFNLLGPICNPAGATRQVLGVSDPRRAPDLLHSLVELGSDRVMVVHGEDGLDEISVSGPTRIWELHDHQITERVFTPEAIGQERLPFEEVAGGDVSVNTTHFMNILAGHDPGPRTILVALNAGAALQVAGLAENLGHGFELAFELLSSGAALEVFETYRHASQEVGRA